MIYLFLAFFLLRVVNLFHINYYCVLLRSGVPLRFAPKLQEPLEASAPSFLSTLLGYWPKPVSRASMVMELCNMDSVRLCVLNNLNNNNISAS